MTVSAVDETRAGAWRTVGERLEATEALDRLAGPMQRAVQRVLPPGRARDALHGVWLGHPLHPLLTDLPIGFWTSSWVLDLVGGRQAQRASDALVGLGVASALPTAAAGLADWSELLEPERRSGAVHALANVTATGLYAASWVARRRGRRASGVALGMAGAAAATVGGFLGGHLAFRRAAGVNQAACAPGATTWDEVSIEGALRPDRATLGHLGDTALAVVGGDEPVALLDRCNHMGGPMHDGELVDGCLRCPWHGSTFRLGDGTVVHGPATAPQPAYELEHATGRLQGRRRRLV